MTLWVAVPLAIFLVIKPACSISAGSPTDAATQPRFGVPATVDEARDRAKILHETIHGVLQVVHRDFFDEDAVHMLPSQSLEDVFIELQRTYGVSIRWISVNAKALNVDHQPRDEFEKKAAAALSSGKEEYEMFQTEPETIGKLKTAGEYRRVGSIRLASQCLKCHLPNRRSTDDRLAGLSIRMQVSHQSRLNHQPTVNHSGTDSRKPAQ